MKTLILAGAVLGLGVGAAYAGDGGDFPMPPPASSRVAPSAPTVKPNAPVLNAFVAEHSTTTSLFPPNKIAGGAHD